MRTEDWNGLRMLKKGNKLDNYEIMALLGTGGFGCVWRAKDLTVKAF